MGRDKGEKLGGRRQLKDKECLPLTWHSSLVLVPSDLDVVPTKPAFHVAATNKTHLSV